MEHYDLLLTRVGELLEVGRREARQKTKAILVETYWHIGQHIVEFEQQGEHSAQYGKQLLDLLSKDLKRLYGKVFSRSNIYQMRQLYLCYPKIQTLSGKSEKQLENQLVDKLAQFLLELGKGFAFIAQQYRVTLNNTHYYVDLLFYHRILKCFVLIDLKLGKVSHHDIGQMNLYLNYFKKEENTEGDYEPIGIVLVADKDEILVEYATGSISNQIFVSRYKTHLPDRKELVRELALLLEEGE